MNRLHTETIIKRKNGIKTVLLTGALVLAIIAGIVIMGFGGYPIFIGALIIFFAGRMFLKLKVEYEYIFVDGQLDIDKVMGGISRKHLVRLDFIDVDLMAPESSSAWDKYKNTKIKVKNYTSGDKDCISYGIMISSRDEKTKILIDPDEKLLNAIRQKNRRVLVEY